MTIQDFTTFTEVDVAGNHIQLVGTNHIDHDAYRNEDTYLYKDRGVGHFTDFTHKIDVKLVSAADAGQGHAWCLTNDVDDTYGLLTGNKTAIDVPYYRYGATYYIYIEELYAGTSYVDYAIISTATWYYLLIKKVGTSLKMGIYSTAAKRDVGNATDGDIDNLTLTLHANHSFRYIFGCNTYNSGHNILCRSDIENLDLQEGVARTKTVTEILGLVDTKTRKATYHRTKTEILGLVDTYDKNKCKKCKPSVIVVF